MKTKLLSLLAVTVAGPIALFAAPADDRKIEDAAKASYNYRTVLDDKVKVKADGGVVTLTGTVQDKDDRDLAADTVENLPGVTAVKNEIKVESAYAERSDGWMALKIRSRLLVKANVSVASTKVDVRDGVVTLTGTADNAAQKDLTGIYAKEIDGVKSVKNELVIQAPVTNGNLNADRSPGATNADRMGGTNADRTTSRGADRMMAAEVIDDASITSQVKFALVGHKSTSALKTKITTTDGVVHVTGVAKNEAEKSLVSKLAQDVRGTKSVKNDMTIAN